MKKTLPFFIALPLIYTSASAELIGHWDFEGDDGAVTVVDVSGNNNTGTLSQNAFISKDETPAVGLGVLLLENGTSGGGVENMSINAGAGGMGLSELPELTVSMWALSADGLEQRDNRIFSEGSTTTNNPLYTLGTGRGATENAATFFRRTTVEGGSVGATLSTATPFGDGEWHHYLLTDNPTPSSSPALNFRTVTVYIDGVPSIRTTYTDAPLGADTTSFGGVVRAAASNGFTGQMDEIAVYDSSLTGNEIRALAAKIAPGTINDTDSDGNGLPDYWETQFSVSDPDANDDGDTLTNIEEFNFGSNPLLADSDGDMVDDNTEQANNTNPQLADTDGDGLDDGAEITAGTNPFNTDSDGDTLLDGYEVESGLDPLDNGENPNLAGMVGDPNAGLNGDPDGDGLTNGQEFAAGTLPRNPDTDMDGLTDDDELNNRGLDPLNNDFDGDTILDGEEVIEGLDSFVTNPKSPDTDFDGITDPDEITAGSDPSDGSDPNPIPAIPVDGLVHLWKFDETSGTTAVDSVGDANAEWNGTPENLSFITDGLIGGAIGAEGDNGVGQRFNVPSTLAIDGSSTFTISMWYQNDGNGDQNYNGLFMSRATSGTTFNWGIAVRDLDGANDRQVDFRIANSNGGSSGNNILLPVVNDPAAWRHVALSYSVDEDLNKVIIASLDGQVMNFDAKASAASTVDGTGWSIGGDGATDARDFDGRFDELAVYNVALTEEEILSLFRNGAAGNSILPGAVIPTETDFSITDFVFNDDGSITVTFDSEADAGTTYTVIGSPDLVGPQSGWTELGTADTGGISTTITTDLGTVPDGAKYFIAVRKNAPMN